MVVHFPVHFICTNKINIWQEEPCFLTRFVPMNGCFLKKVFAVLCPSEKFGNRLLVQIPAKIILLARGIMFESKFSL